MSRRESPVRSPESVETTYNIIPTNNPLADHPCLRFPEVRVAMAALRAVGDLHRPPPLVPSEPHNVNEYDLLDWLGDFFGFQSSNVSNQREHIVLHLANAQMRLTPPPADMETLDRGVVRDFHIQLLSNYTHWCSFLDREHNIRVNDSDSLRLGVDFDLLYVALYLLIWGESANLRFMPECICYIFNNMAAELNKILEDSIKQKTGLQSSNFLPSTNGGENKFLNCVVKPIYDTLQVEVDVSSNNDHSNWLNYDDMNEYFWSRRCVADLKWPITDSFVTTISKGKTGFVEQRSFLNLFRSFDKLWTMLFLFLQAAIIVAWSYPNHPPWRAIKEKDVQAKVLSVFITWSCFRFIKAVLDAVMEYKLVSRETFWLGVRMALKIIFSIVWITVFGILYARIWRHRNNKDLLIFLKAVLVFILPEVLAQLLFILPIPSNLIETTNLKIFHLMTWWFQTRTFVGRGLRKSLIDKLKYSLFWIVVLATKFCFSYLLQIKPIIQPTKDLLSNHHVTYKWHQFFGNSNRFAIVLLWLPVVLIYLMDLQIWYAIYSSFVGVGIGFFGHLGAIQNVQQLRLRFQFFASAMQFNLLSEEQVPTSWSRIKDRIKRWNLRCGFRMSFNKPELNRIDAQKFALIWNEIILTFREEDIISDVEVELLELPLNAWKVSVVRWPCFLLNNELVLAISQAKKLGEKDNVGDRVLWSRMSKNEYRRCSVIETYESVKYLLLTIVKPNTDGHSVFDTLFKEIEESIEKENFTQTFHMSPLSDIRKNLTLLIELLLQPEKDVNKVVKQLHELYEVVILSKKERPSASGEGGLNELKQDGLAQPSDTLLLFVNAVELPDSSSGAFYRQARRLLNILSSHDSMNNIPVNLEARRRIAFFSNSLFMNMPHAPKVDTMMAFSVLTPYYNEHVVYSKEEIRRRNKDGIKTIDYLKTVYPDEWENFLERMRREGLGLDKDLWKTKPRDVRLWASYRGQTLARTVRGMMYYQRTLKMLAFLDYVPEDMKSCHGRPELITDDGNKNTVDDNLERMRILSTATTRFAGHESGSTLMKYTYVVACQKYGTQKAEKEPQAEEILQLMKENELLRVAYVDDLPTSDGTSKNYYSVLVKYDQVSKKEVEVYRVQLPGPMKLGEGKPENQNHALIFTRGDAVQTIDMNQDNYFEEALKMRNLLEEFTRFRFQGSHKPNILGVRENIFTAPVSSLAWFMSAQETSFVTLGQRVLVNPLKIRLHYGHPDVFDRFWFLTRGGISKASKSINLSEDIFAGFNCTLRDGYVSHHEYIQVGKGRDVGLNQISMFEAKVAGGNGEQVLSRDVYRLGHRLDFFRMLSFFYTTVGFFFNTMMVVLTIYAFLWGRLYLALSGVESSVAGNANTNKALAIVINQQFLVQLGLLTVLPMIFENILEFGFMSAFWDFLKMQLQLSSVFFTFSLGTRSHYFGRTILHGGAKYRATGRGFVVQHQTFTENYRLYARSHFIKAIELGLILIMYAIYSPISKGTFTYIVLTISSWFLVVSWIMAPFVFNPFGFNWQKTVSDFDEFKSWIQNGGILESATVENSWEEWWYEEQDHLRTTGVWGKFVEIILDLRFFFFQYGMVYKLGIAAGSKSIAVYLLSWICIAVVFGISLTFVYARQLYYVRKRIYRFVQFLVMVLVILAIIALMLLTKFRLLDLLTSLLAFLPTGWGLLLIAQVFQRSLEKTVIWEVVVSVGRIYEVMFAIIVSILVFALSLLPGPETVQNRILFNKEFSSLLGNDK